MTRVLGALPPPQQQSAAVEGADVPDDPETAAAIERLENLTADIRAGNADGDKILALSDLVGELGFDEEQARMRRLIEPKTARATLDQHLAWIEQNLPETGDLEGTANRFSALQGAYSKHYDGLDPIEDAEHIAVARELFKLTNPDFEEHQ